MATRRPARERARRLRRDSTEAERRLWKHLRDRQVAGAKFRRQVPIGPYVVDFVCFEAKLIVEVDGGQHAAPGVDIARTTLLKTEGYRVLRVWNSDVFENIDGVVSTIELELLKRSN